MLGVFRDGVPPRSFLEQRPLGTKQRGVARWHNTPLRSSQTPLIHGIVPT